MPIIKKAKIKCPNKKCNTLIYREWNLGVLPKLLSMGSLCFKCRKCDAIFHIHTPFYMIEKFLDAMASDPDLIYQDGEWIKKCDQITDEEEKIFVSMLKEKQMEFLDALSEIEDINLENYQKE